ncbi:MAG: heat-inducible transcriptional repressor HrcA, partial [bacterium]
DLEELGVLTQPHPSAGRLPTSLGYRLYVDDLMQAEDLTEEEKKLIHAHLEAVYPRVDELMEQVSSLLAEVSRLLGFIMEPDISSGVLEKVEIVQVAEGRVVLLIIVRSGLVKSIMLELNASIRDEEIAQARRLINQRLTGLRLTDIPQKVHERLSGEWASSNPVIRLVMEFPEKVFSTENRGEVHIGPTSHIIEQPEFAHLKRIKGIIELLDNKDIIVHLLKDQTEGVKVTIGEENPEEELKDFSVITSTYRIGDVSGTLGIIGPMRMNYAKLISLVNYTAQLVSQRISQR